MRFFDRYSGFWRRQKLFYVLYNITQYRHLKTLKPLYRKFGLRRSVLMPLHSMHFKHLGPSSIEDHWGDKGFVVLPSLISEKEVDEVNAAMAEALDQKQIDFNYTGRKILFAYEKVPQLRKLMNHPKIRAVLTQKMGAEVRPFQSINFQYGSEQQAHSDSIHMSTYPKGGLIAAWIALDDVDEENGTLFYYPGSHRLPYVTNEDIGASTSWMLSANPNKLYEDYVQKQVEANGLKKEIFKAKKGDVLIWHANLLHGGLPHRNMERTRRSLVVHYFREGVICYHEISQRPAVIKPI